jgi:hypothetical protein
VLPGQPAARAGQGFGLAADDAAVELPVVSSLVRGAEGRWLADGAEVLSSPAPGARGGQALLSAAELDLLKGRSLFPDGRSVPVLVHGAGAFVRVPVRDPDGTVRDVRVNAGQLADLIRDTLAADATVALLSCRSGALDGGFAHQLATALGRDVLAPVSDLHVTVTEPTALTEPAEPGEPAARLLSAGGQPWMLFVPDGLGGAGWDPVNDEIQGIDGDVRAFDGFTAIAPPAGAGTESHDLHLSSGPTYPQDLGAEPSVPALTNSMSSETGTAHHAGGVRGTPGGAPALHSHDRGVEPAATAPTSSASAAVPPVPDRAQWLRDSSVPFRRRSPELLRIDAALAEYGRRRDDATSTDETRLHLLGRVQEEIVAWRDAKRADRRLPTGSDVPSRRGAAVERLEDSVEQERLGLLGRLAGTVAEGPAPRDHYGHVAVYSAGAMVDNTGRFVAGSATDYEAVRAQPTTAGTTPTELDIRVRMLTDKIRAAHADFESRRASDPNARDAIALFTAPEWYFKRPGTPFTEADKQQIFHTVRSLSAQHPGMLIVPGSVVWGTGRGDGAELRSTTMAVMNGSRLHEQNKRKDAFDTDGYFPDDDEAAGDDTIEQRRYAEWERGGGLRTGADAGRNPREMPPNIDGQPAAFQVGSLTFALEICADNVNGRALWDFGQGRFPQQHPADVHILVSAGASPMPSKAVLREGGIAVGNDGQNRSSASRRGAERKVWVARKAAQPYQPHPDLEIDGERFTFAGQPDRIMDRHDQLNEVFLGLFALPQDTSSGASTAPPGDSTAPATVTADNAETEVGSQAGANGGGRRSPSLGSLHNIISLVTRPSDTSQEATSVRAATAPRDASGDPYPGGSY